MEEQLAVENQCHKETFLVQIVFQQNATWQGTLTWTGRKKSQNFRSALEMLKLMDDALSSAAEDAARPNWEK